MVKTTVLKFGLIVLLIMLASCQFPPKKHSTKIYHADPDVSQVSNPAVLRLHKLSLAANNAGQFNQSINLLQRAINIEPRNPWSWHYLAQSYWHLKQFDECRQMVERSISYAALNHALQKGNAILLKQCQVTS